MVYRGYWEPNSTDEVPSNTKRRRLGRRQINVCIMILKRKKKKLKTFSL